MSKIIIDILRDILIGLVSGGISSLIVSVLLKKHWDKQEHKKDFKLDKQNYCRYIQSIRNELFLAQKSGDYDFVIRAIENEPIRESFNSLSNKSEKLVAEVNDFISNLKSNIESSDCKMSDDNYKVYYGKLFQYSVNILIMSEE